MGWIDGRVAGHPFGPPCKILPRPDEFTYCNRPSNGRTILDYPICDECHAAVRLEGPDA